MDSLFSFYYLSHIIISLSGAVILLAIYFNIKKRYLKILLEDESQKRIDKGLLYLSLALFVWVLSGTWTLLESNLEIGSIFTSELIANLLSILNNAFILMALFYFYYAPSFIYLNTKNVRRILILIVTAALTTMCLTLIEDAAITDGIIWRNVPDFTLSAFLSYLLGFSLVKTFNKRGLHILSVISAIAVFLMLFSQLNVVIDGIYSDYNSLLLKLTSKTVLIFIFLVLATSWVIRLASTPKITETQIKFSDWSEITLSIPSKQILNRKIDFGSKTTQFKNLLKLALRRKYGTGSEASITVGKAGEISNQTYLNRIVNDVNDSLALKDDDTLDRRDLFTFIGEGAYRLRILPAHISVDSSLLDEFITTPENEAYLSIVQSSNHENK